MEVPINLIRPSANPIRQTRDEKKIRELAQSIEIHGILQPIKLRPIIDINECPEHGFFCIVNAEILPDKICYKCDRILRTIWVDEDETQFPVFEIVYGARRFEAALLIGLETVTSVIQRMSEAEARLEGLIENIQREDMSDLELSEAFNQLTDSDGKPLSAEQVSRKVGLSPTRTKTLMNLTVRDKDIAEVFVREITNRHLSDDLGNNSQTKDLATKASFVNQYIKDDIDLRQAVARKVIAEDLSQQKTAKLAEAVAAAPTEQAKKKLLEWEYSPTIHDPELIRERAKTHGAHDPIYRDDKPSPQKEWDDSPQVKMIIDAFRTAIKSFLDLMREMQNLAQIGKLAPEGKQFMIHRLRSFRNNIDQMIIELEDNHG